MASPLFVQADAELLCARLVEMRRRQADAELLRKSQADARAAEVAAEAALFRAAPMDPPVGSLVARGLLLLAPVDPAGPPPGTPDAPATRVGVKRSRSRSPRLAGVPPHVPGVPLTPPLSPLSSLALTLQQTAQRLAAVAVTLEEAAQTLRPLRRAV
jgi:hypothetical protein